MEQLRNKKFFENKKIWEKFKGSLQSSYKKNLPRSSRTNNKVLIKRNSIVLTLIVQ